MKIVVDAFGGDNAPLAVIEGCSMAAKEVDATIVLCGDEQKIRSCAAENSILLDGMEILPAPDVMDMHDEPTELLKSKSNTSMAVGLKAVADGKGDAFVSAGSTGALMVGGTFLTKRLKGVKRPALAPVMPSTGKPYLLIDSGANLDVRPEILVQFAVMGSVYMNKVMGVENPRVGLLNVGTEDTKGGDMLVETYGKLKASPLNFIGNVEARDVPAGVCDVLVTDGFSGNIVLKLTEGTAAAFMGMFKNILTKNAMTKLAASVLMPGLREMKHRLDYTEYGGAPLLGSAKPVIKAHGNSSAKVIKNTVKQAAAFASGGVNEEIATMLAQFKQEKEQG